MTATAPRDRSAGATARLTREAEVELARRIEMGDRSAREELIVANQGLIGHVLRTEFRGFIYLWEDLFQEGQVGLIKAVDRFNWRKGCKFSSYAVWWIRREIQLALGRWWTGAARIPESRLKELRAFNLSVRRLEDRLDRHPTPDEIAAELGISLDRVYDILNTMVTSKQSVSVEGLEESGRSALHLAADKNPTRSEEDLEPWLQNKVRRAIRVSLTAKQREVILLHYGLDLDGEPLRPLSEREIAQQMGISPQAVSRIEERALARIKAEMDLLPQPLRRVE